MTFVTVDRLQRGSDIAAVLHGRRQRGGRLLALHVLARPDEGPARVAVIASRRVGGAVQRNRAKRLLREAVRRVSWRAGLDVVVIARRACAQSQLGPVHSELDDLASRLDAVREAA